MVTNNSYFKTAEQLYSSVTKALEKALYNAKENVDNAILHGISHAVNSHQLDTEIEIYGLDLSIALPKIKKKKKKTVVNLKDYGYEVKLSFNIEEDDEDYNNTTDWTCFLHISWDLGSSTENKN